MSFCEARQQGPPVAQLHLLQCPECADASCCCRLGLGLPGMGSAGPTPANCPVSRALPCYLWGETGADPAVPSSLFPYPPANFGTHQLSVSIHLSSVYPVLGNLVVKSATSKDLGSNPSLASSMLCDLGQVVQLSAP